MNFRVDICDKCGREEPIHTCRDGDDVCGDCCPDRKDEDGDVS